MEAKVVNKPPLLHEAGPDRTGPTYGRLPRRVSVSVSVSLWLCLPVVWYGEMEWQSKGYKSGKAGAGLGPKKDRCCYLYIEAGALQSIVLFKWRERE